MAWFHVLAHVALPCAIAAAAGFGAWRAWRLWRIAPDPRLAKLLWFYALFSLSLVSIAIWTGQLSYDASAGLSHDADVTGGHGEGHSEFVDNQRIDGFLVAHHVLMLASLGIAVQAFSHKRRSASVALAGLAVLAPLVPVVLAVEAALTLYLAIVAILNHRERRSPGALQVAAGFLLFFIGHLSFFIFHNPGVARTPLGDIFALVGIVLLVRLLPRPTA